MMTPMNVRTLGVNAMSAAPVSGAQESKNSDVSFHQMLRDSRSTAVKPQSAPGQNDPAEARNAAARQCSSNKKTCDKKATASRADATAANEAAPDDAAAPAEQRDDETDETRAALAVQMAAQASQPPPAPGWLSVLNAGAQYADEAAKAAATDGETADGANLPAVTPLVADDGAVVIEAKKVAGTEAGDAAQAGFELPKETLVAASAAQTSGTETLKQAATGDKSAAPSVIAKPAETEVVPQVATQSGAARHLHEITYDEQGTHVFVGSRQPATFTVVGAAGVSAGMMGQAQGAGTQGGSLSGGADGEKHSDGKAEMVLSADDLTLTVGAGGKPADFAGAQVLADRPIRAEQAAPVAEGGRATGLMRAVIEALPKPLAPMNIQIHPEGFGTIHIRIVPTVDAVNGNSYRVDIRATDNVAHTLLTNHAAELKQELSLESVRISGPARTTAPEAQELKDESAGRNGSQRGSRSFEFERQGGSRRGRELFELLDESRRQS
jgi:hypothetical protein